MLSVEPIVQAPPIADLFHAVSRRSSCFFLDSSMNIKRLGNYSYLGCDPYLTFQAKGKCVQITRKGKTQTILDHPLEQLRKILAEQPPISASPFPFCGGAVGYFAYDSYPWIEPIAQSHPDELNLPDIFFAFYDGLFVCDHCNDRLYALATGYPSPTKTTLTRLKSILHEASKGSFCKEWPTNLVPVSSNFDFESYCAAVDRVRQYIAAGDVYQVNLSQRFSCSQEIPPSQLFSALRCRYPSPFGAYLDFGDFQVLSNSPERFFNIAGDRLKTQPIKGTKPRGTSPAQDQALKKSLIESEKDRAELLMIVDLERNDVAKVAIPGTVEVPACFAIATYPTVFHLSATVTGQLRPGIDFIDCLKALFPGGSVTGAPKIRAMQIINELETVRRGIFTGALGWIGLNGDADLSIAIRTLTCKHKQCYFHAGGGVVWDSIPEQEYQETMVKAHAWMEVLGGLVPSYQPPIQKKPSKAGAFF